MHPEQIQKLIDFFTRLPGIGPRQASRFVSALLDEDQEQIKNFGEALFALASSVGRCEECFRSISTDSGAKKCLSCASATMGAILVVEKDQDLETITKSGLWQEGYHVLGGTISILNEKSRVTERIKALYERAFTRSKNQPLEIVLATSTTTEGDATALYIERILEPLVSKNLISLSRLGRGISSGTEMEFADPQTLKNAIKNRK